MAPGCPEEVDVFTVPHSRMKELVHRYLEMVMDTNFSDVRNLTNLLENLCNTFHEFKTHEQIENKYIMKRLKDKLKKLSIKNTAVCNCHSDNRLTQMLLLLKDGYKLTRKSVADRINYGTQLRKELEDFTEKFIPHMEEEESVFQPLLMKYFSVEELKSLKNTVIQQHVLRISQVAKEAEEKILLDELTSESDEEDDKHKKKEEKCEIDKVPDEVMVGVFKYLNPKELLQCAQVSQRWNNLALDGSLWKTFCPVQWSKGNWTFTPRIDVDKEEQNLNVMKQLMNEVTIDEDADIDETDESESSDGSLDVRKIYHEANLLTSMVKYLLPRIGNTVKTCNLAYSKGLTNGTLYKILSQCPNLEVLDLTQTHISDIGFKGFGRKGCGRKLKRVDLSGCINITDVTLQRLSSALGYLPCHTEVPESTQDDVDQKLEKNETEASEKMEVKETFKESKTKEKLHIIEKISSCDKDKHIWTCLKSGKTKEKDYIIVNPKDGKIILQDCDKDYDTYNGLITIETCSSEKSELLDFDTLNSSLKEICDRFEDEILRNASDQRTNCEAVTAVPNRIRGNTNVPLSNCYRVALSGQNSGRVTNFGDYITPDWTCRCKSFGVNSAITDKDVCDSDNGQLNNPVAERKLEFLSLSGCFHITDQGIRALADNGGLPHLQHLDLSGCFHITAEGLTDLVSVCPTLNHELLFYCDNLFNDPFADSASGCQNLECPSRYCCRLGN